jgi:hypothetical protein
VHTIAIALRHTTISLAYFYRALTHYGVTARFYVVCVEVLCCDIISVERCDLKVFARAPSTRKVRIRRHKHLEFPSLSYFVSVVALCHSNLQLIQAYHERSLSGRRIDQLCLAHLRVIGYLSQDASAAELKAMAPALKLVNDERRAAAVRKKAEERVSATQDNTDMEHRRTERPTPVTSAGIGGGCRYCRADCNILTGDTVLCLLQTLSRC